MAHAWQNDPAGSTKDDVVWVCPLCLQVVGFNRKGVGEPFGSETEHPANIDDYANPCVPEPTKQEKVSALLAKVVRGGLDLDALVRDGKLTAEDEARVIQASDSLVAAPVPAPVEEPPVEAQPIP